MLKMCGDAEGLPTVCSLKAEPVMACSSVPLSSRRRPDTWHGFRKWKGWGPADGVVPYPSTHCSFWGLCPLVTTSSFTYWDCCSLNNTWGGHGENDLHLEPCQQNLFFLNYPNKNGLTQGFHCAPITVMTFCFWFDFLQTSVSLKRPKSGYIRLAETWYPSLKHMTNTSTVRGCFIIGPLLKVL